MLRTFDDKQIDLNGKTILVTGGTGSFGRRFVGTVLGRYDVRRCIVFSRDEQKHYDMSQIYRESEYRSVRYFIGDVRDQGRLELAMRDVDYVVHAAALKHVPAAEYNPFECIMTNVHGAEHIVKAALRTGVKKVIALSTDKAASPINLYGASKLASDKIFVAANNLSGREGARFAVVRYGNVVGSRGSVVPFFQKLVAEGADHLPITDPRMTRFWITLQQGVEFVLSCLDLMRGGEIFVPKIPSMKMTDIASLMAPGLPQKTVGIRPGEKLHEVMIPEDDSRTTVELADRYVITPAFYPRLHEHYLASGGKRVPDDYRYASDTNHEWLTPAEFKAMLASLDKDAMPRAA